MDTMNKKKALPDISSAHQHFLSTGKIKSALLRKEIKESWMRCRALGIDPYDGSSPIVLSEGELAALLTKKKSLIAIAVPFMERLYEVISDSGFAVVLTDEQGFILEAVRTPELEEAVLLAHVNYLPGSRWREEDVGTNGIDLVLRLKKPYQISGAEHYAVTHHPSACIGAPIFNADGQLTGTLTASGFAQSTQRHAPIGHASNLYMLLQNPAGNRCHDPCEGLIRPGLISHRLRPFIFRLCHFFLCLYLIHLLAGKRLFIIEVFIALPCCLGEHLVLSGRFYSHIGGI